MKRKRVERRAWMIVAGGAAMLAGTIVKRGLDASWRAYSDDEPPERPWRGDGWGTSLLWTTMSAAAVAVSGLLATQATHTGWKRVTGHAPPSA